MTIAYSPDALVYDAVSDSWSLRPDYDLTQHRVDIQFSDDDAYIDGDWNWGELGDDVTQTATVHDMQGNLIASGTAYAEDYHEIRHPDFHTSQFDVIEINGVVVAIVVEDPLVQGVSYPVTIGQNVGNGFQTPKDDTRQFYTNQENVSYFGPGTHLMTPEGEVPVDWIAKGDRLLTRDSGAQPVLWVGRCHISAETARADTALWPFQIEAGALGTGHPAHPTMLSPQHRVLLSGCDIELHTGTDEALAPVKHLEDSGLFTPLWPERDLVYTYVLLERHEVIMANGMWVESLFLDEYMAEGLRSQLPPDLWTCSTIRQGHTQAARLCLKRHEVAAVLGYHATARLPELLRTAD